VSALEIVSALDQTLLALESRPWEYLLNGPLLKYPITEHWIVTRDIPRIVNHVTRGGNLGLVCHERTGIAVLDADNLDLWREMTEDLGEPGKPWVKTGGGKLHYYVRWEPSLPAKILWNGVKVGEIQRGPGQQQVVLPPSIHPDTGAPYRWITEAVPWLVEPIHPVVDPLPRLPDAWRAQLQTQPHATRR
jgi:hypothetical protein